MRPLFAVTGATGCLGRSLIGTLESLGTVSVLARTPSAYTESLRASGHRIVPGALDDDGSLDALVQGASVVFHCAARLGNANPAASWRANVDGTERLAMASVRAGVRRFVYVSSISVYSATDRPDAITESDLPRNLERLCTYARTKYEGEIVARAAAERSGMEVTIVRPTNVYGPWSQPWFLGWARMLRRLPVAFGNLPIDVVHVDDVAAALLAAGTLPAAGGETLHIGHDVVLLRDFIASVGDVIGRRVWRLPDAADAIARRAADFAFSWITGTRIAMPLTRPSIYPHTKALRVIHYTPRIDLIEGFASLRQWYQGGMREPGTVRLPHHRLEPDRSDLARST